MKKMGTENGFWHAERYKPTESPDRNLCGNFSLSYIGLTRNVPERSSGSGKIFSIHCKRSIPEESLLATWMVPVKVAYNCRTEEAFGHYHSGCSMESKAIRYL